MGLTDLPPELILRVSAHLTTPELGTLRRSCKHIEAVIFDSFAKEFFTKRQFMIEEVSLQALVDIANHPILSSRLCEVIIGLETLIEDDNYEPEDSRAVFNAGHAGHSALLATGQARDMLVEAFSKLTNLRTVGLRDYAGAGRFRDGPYATWRSYGLSQVIDSFHSHGRSGDIVSPTTVFPLILYSVGQAKARPTSIEVFLRRHSKLTPLALNVVTGHVANAVIPVLAGLTRLMLTVALSSPADRMITGLHEGSIAVAPLKRMLHHTPNLQTLRVNFEQHQPLAQDFLEWLGTPVAGLPLATNPANGSIPPVGLTKLTNLDLGMLTVQGATLAKAIANCNLSALSLWKVDLRLLQSDTGFLFSDPEPNAWADFCMLLSNVLPSSTALKTVMIGYPSQTRRPYPLTQARFRAEDGQKRAPLLDTVRYRGGYGTDVRGWLRSISERTYLPTNDTSDSESGDDDDGDDDSDDDGSDDDNDDVGEDDDLDDFTESDGYD